MSRFSIVLILCVLIIVPTAQAQFSFLPKPLPEASVFLITEIGYVYRVSQSIDEDNNFFSESRHHYISEIGFMKNLNPHYAVGGNFYFENEGRSASRAGFKVRLRKWLDRYSLDLSTGLLFWDSRYNAYSGLNLPPIPVETCR